MPRIKSKQAVYAAEDFKRQLSAGLALRGMRAADLAEAMQISGAALSKKRQNVNRLTVDDLRIMLQQKVVDGEAILKLLGGL